MPINKWIRFGRDLIISCEVYFSLPGLIVFITFGSGPKAFGSWVEPGASRPEAHQAAWFDYFVRYDRRQSGSFTSLSWLDHELILDWCFERNRLCDGRKRTGVLSAYWTNQVWVIPCANKVFHSLQINSTAPPEKFWQFGTTFWDRYWSAQLTDLDPYFLCSGEAQTDIFTAVNRHDQKRYLLSENLLRLKARALSSHDSETQISRNIQHQRRSES